LKKALRVLRRDVDFLGGLVERAGRAVLPDLSGRRVGVFELEVHLGAVEMVRVRWEVEGRDWGGG
jgi:hypothetical protein